MNENDVHKKINPKFREFRSFDFPEENRIKTMATNAAKAAFYAPSYCGLDVRFGSLEECIDAAVTGEWNR